VGYGGLRAAPQPLWSVIKIILDSQICLGPFSRIKVKLAQVQLSYFDCEQENLRALTMSWGQPGF